MAERLAVVGKAQIIQCGVVGGDQRDEMVLPVVGRPLGQQNLVVFERPRRRAETPQHLGQIVGEPPRQRIVGAEKLGCEIVVTLRQIHGRSQLTGICQGNGKPVVRIHDLF